MTDKTPKSEKVFVRQLVLISLVLLLFFAAAGTLIYKNLPAVQVFSVKVLASLGSFDPALDIAEAIEDESSRLSSSYLLADKMHEKGRCQQAAQVFKSLSDYKDSADRYLESSYAHAEQLFSQAEYEQARDTFIALGDYADSSQRQKDCVYAMAAAAFDSGDYLSASTLFAGLGSYCDAAARAFDAAMAITGDENAAQVLVNSGGLSPESAEKAAEIAAIRAELPLGRLAAGSFHTLYLRDDGTAAACGENSDGRCDVQGWSGLVQVCAGAKHSVALRADGSVLATGDNSYGQCDVSGWKNVVSIAAGDYDTVALLEDGSLVSCGYHDYETLRNAKEISSIYTGSYGAAAVSTYGYMLSSHSSLQAENAQLLLDYAIGTGCSAALYADGRLEYRLSDAGCWEDIVYVDISPRAMLAVNAEGQLLSRFFRETDSVEFTGLKNVSLCTAGAEHYVFLQADGSLAAYGDNSRGQCNVATLLSPSAK